MIRAIGPILSTLAVLLAAVLAARTYAPFGLKVSVGMALGAASIAAMGIALVLSARPTWIEGLFGGLVRWLPTAARPGEMTPAAACH